MPLPYYIVHRAISGPHDACQIYYLALINSDLYYADLFLVLFNAKLSHYNHFLRRCDYKNVQPLPSNAIILIDGPRHPPAPGERGACDSLTGFSPLTYDGA
jgi:hypothetical protein